MRHLDLFSHGLNLTLPYPTLGNLYLGTLHHKALPLGIIRHEHTHLGMLRLELNLTLPYHILDNLYLGTHQQAQPLELNLKDTLAQPMVEWLNLTSPYPILSKPYLGILRLYSCLGSCKLHSFIKEISLATLNTNYG